MPATTSPAMKTTISPSATARRPLLVSGFDAVRMVCVIVGVRMTGPRIAHRSAVVAAALAAPAFLPLPDGERSDGKGGERVEPPQCEQRVTEQADENGGGEVGAEDVLGSLTGGLRRLARPAPPARPSPPPRGQQRATR